jgi:hypothetical protein
MTCPRLTDFYRDPLSNDERRDTLPPNADDTQPLPTLVFPRLPDLDLSDEALDED